MTLADLYAVADDCAIDVDYFPMREVVSCSFPQGCIAIDVDKLADTVEEKVCLAHELGHCVTGSFYNIYSPLNNVRQQERRADRWAIKKLVPEDELKEVLRCGYCELYEIAEYFEVSEDFARKACEYYFCA